MSFTKQQLTALLQDNVVNITAISRKNNSPKQIAGTLKDSIIKDIPVNHNFQDSLIVTTNGDMDIKDCIICWDVNRNEWIRFIVDNVQSAEIATNT
jgi:hypothetical protein